MLPTSPQSIADLFLNAFRSYKKVFWYTFPIIVIYVLTSAAIKILNNGDAINWLSIGFYFLMVTFISACWNRAIYKFIADGKTNYWDLVLFSIKRIPLLIVAYFFMIAMLVSLGGVLGFIYGFIIYLLQGYKLLVATPLIVFSIPIIVWILSFYFVFTFKYLFKGKAFFLSFKDGFKLSFRFNNLWRVMIFILIAFLLMAIFYIVPAYWLDSNIVLKKVFEYLLQPFVCLQFIAIFYVYFYHDFITFVASREKQSEG